MKNIILRSLVLIRADIARLPFASSSIDAVHAGAALHCWPSPSAAVSIFHLYLGVIGCDLTFHSCTNEKHTAQAAVY